MRTLYHGSTQPIEYPLAKIGRDNLDFGKGFYVTCLRRQAVLSLTFKLMDTFRLSSPSKREYTTATKSFM